MTYYRQIELKTAGGTGAVVFVASDSMRFLDLATEAMEKLTDSFDVIEKADAVLEAEGIVYDELWKDVIRLLEARQ